MSYFGFCRRLTERILKNEQIKLFIAANKFSHSELKSLLVVSSNKTFCGLSHNFACFQPFFILNSRAFDIIQHKNNVIFQSHHRHHRPCVAEEIFHNLFFAFFHFSHLNSTLPRGSPTLLLEFRCSVRRQATKQQMCVELLNCCALMFHSFFSVFYSLVFIHFQLSTFPPTAATSSIAEK